MAESSKGSVLPWLIVGGAAIFVAVRYMRARDPVSGAATGAGDSPTKTPGGVIDGVISGVKGLRDGILGLGGLFTDGTKPTASIKPVTKGVSDPFFTSGKDAVPSKSNTKRAAQSRVPLVNSRTWSDDAVIGLYS